MPQCRHTPAVLQLYTLQQQQTHIVFAAMCEHSNSSCKSLQQHANRKSLSTPSWLALYQNMPATALKAYQAGVESSAVPRIWSGAPRDARLAPTETEYGSSDDRRSHKLVSATILKFTKADIGGEDPGVLRCSALSASSPAEWNLGKSIFISPTWLGFHYIS